MYKKIKGIINHPKYTQEETLMLHIVLTVFVLVLGGLAVWQEVRLGNIEKDIKNLKFAKGQDIPRQEFDALKMLVNRLRRGNRNEV